MGNSKEPYGVELATKVAKKLKVAYKCCYSHKEYCGIGLSFDTNTFYITRVYNGIPERREPSFFETKSEQAFIQFLAAQTDATMSGTVSDSVFYESSDFFRNNQRITKEMLEEFIKPPGHTVEPSQP